MTDMKMMVPASVLIEMPITWTIIIQHGTGQEIVNELLAIYIFPRQDY